jgi:hypothetical protein
MPSRVFLGAFMFIDFVILPSEFHDTTIRFMCETEAAQRRFDGATVVIVRKSTAPAMAEKLESEGFVVKTA